MQLCGCDSGYCAWMFEPLPTTHPMCAWSHVQWHCKRLNEKIRRGALTHGSAHSMSLGMHWSLWVMRQECRSLEKCSWYWRARLSGSAKQLILGGFSHCCFDTYCESALLFCSISFFFDWGSIFYFCHLSGSWLSMKIISLICYRHAAGQPVKHHKRWLLITILLKNKYIKTHLWQQNVALKSCSKWGEL